ncbi:MAG: YaaL family protein [Oscillospiraceae bacterium]|nr:YaaL family protein [Oscillospiraceae bacterium]
MPEPQRVFSFGRRPRPQSTERQELLESLAATRMQINQAYSGFDTARDPDLVESFVYEINALQSRYSYLLRRIKELEAAP